jgi:Kef-type K+ transport system membrane component KefB
MLFFFAGYEIDFEADQGEADDAGRLGLVALPGRSPTGSAGILAAVGVVALLPLHGSALATTAIGTLIPILRDNGELKTRFGTYLLAAGVRGEFGPILLVTLVLSTGIRCTRR